jgi:hypothetical protein
MPSCFRKRHGGARLLGIAENQVIPQEGSAAMPTTATATTVRAARIMVGEKGANRAVRVLHPGRLTADDMLRINKILVEDVIKGLTGCACLSGVIDVIWEKEFDHVLDVKLGAPAHV